MQTVNLDWLVWFIALPVVIGVPVLVARLIKGGPSAVLAGSRVLETVFEVALPTQRSSHQATLRVNRLASEKNPVQIAVHTRSATSRGMSCITFAADGAKLLAEHIERGPLRSHRECCQPLAQPRSLGFRGATPGPFRGGQLGCSSQS